MHWYLKIKDKNQDNDLIQRLLCRILSNFVKDDGG
jgi:hypothetical protein